MKPSLRLTGAITVLAMGLTPYASAAAPSRPAAKTPPRPAAGKWHVTGTELSGSFRVTPSHRGVTHFKTTIGPDAETACGAGTVTVLGKHKIFDAKGTDPEGDRYSIWAVGRNRSDDDPVIQPIKVTVKLDGHRRKGHVEMAFVGARGHSKAGDAAGQIIYGKGCDLQFDMRKA
jgi:hypothetical protein